MIGLFLTPIAAGPDPKPDPPCLAASKQVPGRIRSAMLSAAGKDTAFFMCEADGDFSAILKVAGVVLIGTGPTVKDIYQSTVPLVQLDPKQQSDLDPYLSKVLSVSDKASLTTVGDLVAKVTASLESAAHPDLFDAPSPSKSGTISDPFTGTGTMGSGWTVAAGTVTYARVSDQAIATVASNTGTIIRTETTFPNDQWSQIDMQWQSASPTAEAIVVARSSGVGAAYQAHITNNDLEIRRTGTYLTDFAGTYAAATLYTIKIDCTGTTITVYRNGVSQGSTTDSNLTSGKPGFGIFQSGAAGTIAFDNFQCIDASGGTTVLDFIGTPPPPVRRRPYTAAHFSGMMPFDDSLEQRAATLWPAAVYDDRVPMRARRTVEFPASFETIAPEQFDRTLLADAEFVDRAPMRAKRVPEYPNTNETIAPEQFQRTLLSDAEYVDRTPARAARVREFPAAAETIAPEQFDITPSLLWGSVAPDRLVRPKRLIEFPAAFETIAPEQFDRTLLADTEFIDRAPLRAARPREYPAVSETIAPEPFDRILLSDAEFIDRAPFRAKRVVEYPGSFETIAPEQFAVTLWWGFSESAPRPVRATRLREYPAAQFNPFTPGAAVVPTLCLTVLPDHPRRQRRSPVPYLPATAIYVRVPPGSTLKDFDFVGPPLPPWAARRLRTAIQQAMMAMGEPSGIADVPDHGMRAPKVAGEFLTIPFAFDIIFVETEDGGDFLIRPYGR